MRIFWKQLIDIQYNLLNSSNKRACSNRFVNVTIVSSKYIIVDKN